MPASTEPFIGVLMLDTSFERIVGDAGNPSSYPFPARISVVPNADPTCIVQGQRPTVDLVNAFCDQARQLQADGAVGIVSTCGFLIHVQYEIGSAVDVPVVVSALTAAPMILAATGQKAIGIITASASALGVQAIAAAGLVSNDVVIAGLEDEPAFAQVYTAAKGAEESVVNYPAIETAVITRATQLVAGPQKVGAIILECANLPPYKSKIAAATGLPVFEILDCAQLLWSANSRSGNG